MKNIGTYPGDYTIGLSGPGPFNRAPRRKWMQSEYACDHPILTSEEDQLGRTGFATNVAKVLASIPLGDNLVVGIHGPWGDGKSSVLNLVKSELRQHHDVIIRDFNPWRLSDEEKMLRSFIMLLASSIGESLKTRSEKAGNFLAPVIGAARKVTGLVTPFSKSAETLDDLLAKLGEIAKSGDEIKLDDLRQRLVDQLKKSTRRIVVVIDDIDRLDRTETHTLFMLVKACANFPNICYLLAFDDVAVSKTLGNRYGTGDEESGRAFLEKIIQIPLKLPQAVGSDLRLLCLGEVQRVLNQLEVSLSEDEIREFVTNFDQSLYERIENPRSAKRYANALMFAIPMLIGEVSIVDLMLLEGLRAFYPDIFDLIRKNQSAFTGIEPPRTGSAESGPKAVQILRPQIEKLDRESQGNIQALISALFPRLRPAYLHGGHPSSDSLQEWSLQQRVCSSDYCPRYFTYSIPNGDIPDSAIARLLESAVEGDTGHVDSLLKEGFESGRAKLIIAKLRSLEEKVNSRAVRPICLGIAKLASLLPNPQTFMPISEPPTQAGILISHLIRRIDSLEARLVLAKEIVKVSDPLWFGSECVRWLYVTDDEAKKAQNTLTKEQIEFLTETLVARIKSNAAEGHPLFDPKVFQEKYLLQEWKRAEGREPVQAHLLRVFQKDPEQVKQFLRSMASRSWSMMDGKQLDPELMPEHVKEIESLIDLQELHHQIQMCFHGKLETPQPHPDRSKPIDQRLAEQFLFTFMSRANVETGSNKPEANPPK